MEGFSLTKSADPVVEKDAGALASRAAELIAVEARSGIALRGLFALALSGGSTPSAMLDRLTLQDLPWEHVHLFQVDERILPDGHPDRNSEDLSEHLIARIDIPASNVHLMPVTEPDPQAATRGYAAELAAVCGRGARLDLVHLGLGDDGHTASWPPGDPVADSGEADVAVVGPYRGQVRMTLTPPAVNRARQILWLVSGEGKADAVRRLLSGDPRLPASRVATENATLLLDLAAASKLGNRPHRQKG